MGRSPVTAVAVFLLVANFLAVHAGVAAALERG